MFRRPGVIDSFQESDYLLSSDRRHPINFSDAPVEKCSVFKTVAKSGAKITIAFVLSAPTAAQNFLGALNIDLGTIQTWGQLAHEVEQKSGGDIALATGSMTNSLLLNMAVNFLYFSKSMKKTGMTFVMFKDWILGNEVDKVDLLGVRTPAIIGALVAFLTYYSLGSSTFPEGTNLLTHGVNIVAGIASGTSFFITRFNGMEWLLSLGRRDQRIKRKYIDILSRATEDETDKISGFHSIEDAFKSLLRNVVTDELPETSICTRLLKKLPTIVGAGLGANALLVQPIVTYNFLNGAEELFKSSWFANDNYQGPWQLILGHPLSLVNSVFFFKAALLFPGHLVELAQNMNKLFKANKCKMTLGLVGIAAVLALGAWSGQGMGGVAESAYDDGVLDYIVNIASFLTETVFKFVNWAGSSIINADSVIVIANNLIKRKLFDSDEMTIDRAIDLIQQGDPEIIKILNGIEAGDSDELLETAGNIEQFNDRNYFEEAASPRAPRGGCPCTIL